MKNKADNCLLKHEQGHYLIGSICALEFFFKCKMFYFSENYRSEIADLFNEILNKYCAIEVQYDKDTNHYHNKRF